MHDSRRNRLVLGVLLAAALALITLNARNSSAAPVRAMRAFGGVLFGSAESAASAVGGPVAGFFSNLGAGSRDRAKINSLQREVVQLRGELSQAQISKTDAAQLQQLLQLAGTTRYRPASSRPARPTRTRSRSTRAATTASRPVRPC